MLICCCFGKKYNLLYAVTTNKIFAFTFVGTDSEIKPSKPLYEVKGDEVISSGKLFIQGEYNFEPTTVGGSVLPDLKYNCMALILSIQKGAEGIVRILPIDPNFATSGLLLPDKAYDYTGFGTILDVTPIKYLHKAYFFYRWRAFSPFLNKKYAIDIQ